MVYKRRSGDYGLIEPGFTYYLPYMEAGGRSFFRLRPLFVPPRSVGLFPRRLARVFRI